MVEHELCVQKVPGSIPGVSGLKGIMGSTSGEKSCSLPVEPMPVRGDRSVTACSVLDEEINHMKCELEKYGLQLPSFSKIGGILANELSVDEAAGRWRRRPVTHIGTMAQWQSIHFACKRS